jgi:hypothetical protein
MIYDQTFEPTTMVLDRPTEAQPTVMTREHHTMLVTWRFLLPTINTEGLAGNLMRRFNMDAGTAWILAARFNNQEVQ